MSVEVRQHEKLFAGKQFTVHSSSNYVKPIKQVPINKQFACEVCGIYEAEEKKCELCEEIWCEGEV